MTRDPFAPAACALNCRRAMACAVIEGIRANAAAQGAGLQCKACGTFMLLWLFCAFPL
ncbi:MAG: hypothetical protein LUF28_06770 [Clostridiales bacterium]|nr:hypothetical protein [Clostridiales bacterium]